MTQPTTPPYAPFRPPRWAFAPLIMIPLGNLALVIALGDGLNLKGVLFIVGASLAVMLYTGLLAFVPAWLAYLIARRSNRVGGVVYAFFCLLMVCYSLKELRTSLSGRRAKYEAAAPQLRAFGDAFKRDSEAAVAEVNTSADEVSAARACDIATWSSEQVLERNIALLQRYADAKDTLAALREGLVARAGEAVATAGWSEKDQAEVRDAVSKLYPRAAEDAAAARSEALRARLYIDLLRLLQQYPGAWRAEEDGTLHFDESLPQDVKAEAARLFELIHAQGEREAST